MLTFDRSLKYQLALFFSEQSQDYDLDAVRCLPGLFNTPPEGEKSLGLRLGAEQQEQELRGLLGKVIAQIQVAILAIDDQNRIRLINPQAAKLAGKPADQLINQPIGETSFAKLDFSSAATLIDREFPGVPGVGR